MGSTSLSHLSTRERHFYEQFVERNIEEFTIEMARVFGVTNRTIINWSAALANAGPPELILVKQRIRSYRVVR